ncbi:unnamed protein product, partial [Pylaiella littoralis]
MRQAAIDAEQQFEIWKPDFLLRQRNKGYQRKAALRKLRKARKQWEKALLQTAACRQSWEDATTYCRAVEKECLGAAAVHSLGTEEAVDVSHAQAGKLYQRALALRMVFQKLLAGAGKREAFEGTAKLVDVAATTVQRWERMFRNKGHIELDQTGRHERRWILSLDEGLLVIIRRWVRLNTTIKGEPNMTTQKFRDFINTEIIPEIAATKTDKVPATDMTREIPACNPFQHAPVTKTTSKEEVVTYSIGLTTATSWLHKLGCQYRDPR